MQEVNFSAGEVLGSGGTGRGEYIYLIAQGQVDVLRSTSSSAASGEADVDADDDIADDTHCQYPHTCSHTFLLVTIVLKTVVITNNKRVLACVCVCGCVRACVSLSPIGLCECVSCHVFMVLQVRCLASQLLS